MWSVCRAVPTVLCKDARQMHAAVDSDCNENAQMMCELQTTDVCWLQRKSMALWRGLGGGRALALMHRWRCSGV